ncbi:MAG: thiamine-phosphate kinase [Nitrospirota bacterium]|nr:thiamine-phosphate kinase [Nitrospirota bacterium]
MVAEFDFIQRVRAVAPSGSLALGIGDDCAVWSPAPGCDQLVTSDLLIEGVHFTLGHGTLEDLGAKALAVNLSDVAAMGGTPRHAVLGLGLPGREPARFLPLVDGFCTVARRCGVTLAGGDTCASPGSLMIAVTVLGEVPEGRAVRRSGARAGDALYVTGTPGDSALGLRLLTDGPGGVPQPAREELVRRHLAPRARVAEGPLLREAGVSAMIDISDGLLRDLGHILEQSGVGARVDAELLPVSAALQAACRSLGLDAVPFAAGGGEDYELLFTVPADAVDRVEALVRAGSVAAVRIGSITTEPGLQWYADGRACRPPAPGYEHFLQ